MMDKQEFYQISQKLLLKNSAGKVLVLKAVSNGTFSGFYDFPGGRIDTDEFTTPFEEILKREVEEELGLMQISINPTPVAIGRHLILAKFTSSKQKDIPVLYLFFDGQYIAGNIILSSEHSSFEWVDLDGLDLEKYFTSGILEGVKMYLQRLA